MNYLRPTVEEMGDAEFIAEVSAKAGCGILLDLHNAYCNERNGRASLEDFVSRLPAERVLEIHLAGGMEHEGYWLDAHSGAMPIDLLRRSCSLVRGLPNVGAIIFEIYPTYLDRIGEEELLRILDEVRRVWDNVGQARGDGRHVDSQRAGAEAAEAVVVVAIAPAVAGVHADIEAGPGEHRDGHEDRRSAPRKVRGHSSGGEAQKGYR